MMGRDRALRIEIAGLGIEGFQSKTEQDEDGFRSSRSSLYLPLDHLSGFTSPELGSLSPVLPKSPSEVNAMSSQINILKHEKQINPMYRDFSTPQHQKGDPFRLDNGEKHVARPFYSQRYNTRLPPAILQRLDTPACWLLYYFILNLSLTLHNKFVLVKFPFPWALTATHCLLASAGSQILRSQGAFTPAKLNMRENAILAAFSLLFTINIAVSNLSLNLVSVPLHQVIRASTPLFTIAVGFLFLNKSFSAKTLLSLVPVIAGVGLATLGDYNCTIFGFFLTVLGTFLAALKTVMTNVIQVGRLKLHPLDLLN